MPRLAALSFILFGVVIIIITFVIHVLGGAAERRIGAQQVQASEDDEPESRIA
jgi:hypothetical protein